MEVVFSIRPLLLFIIEIILCYLIITSKSKIKWPAFFLVLFLALYQLGEVLILFTQIPFVSIFAFTATSLVPVTALLLIEKIKTNTIKYTPYLYIVPLFFIIYAIMKPEVFSVLSIDYCFIKYGNLIATSTLYYAWASYYYIPFLSIGLIYSIIQTQKSKSVEQKMLFTLMTLNYIVTLPTSFLLAGILNHSPLYIVSTMCSLAVFTCIITYIMVLKTSKNHKNIKSH